MHYTGQLARAVACVVISMTANVVYSTLRQKPALNRRGIWTLVMRTC